MRQAVKTLYLIMSWILVLPLSIVVPKDKSLTVFVSRFGNTFEGNLKYFYIYLNQKHPDRKTCYLTEEAKFYHHLKKDIPNVLYYPKFSSFLTLLRAHTVVVDGNEWTNNFKVFFLFKAKKVQLWHGNGMKSIGLQNAYFSQSRLRQIKFKLLQSYPTYDVVTLPSKMQVEKRGAAFNKKDVLLNGQPRNDILFPGYPETEQTDYGTDKQTALKIKELKKKGYKIILFSPTWKVVTEDKQKVLSEQFKLDELVPFLEKHKLAFVFKLHPKDTLNYGDLSHPLILKYDKDRDIYPVFKEIDLMITDYSSIYMDYLLLDRPIVFFSYDQEEYIKNERALQYDYEAITPGKKTQNTEELINELQTVLVDERDKYSKARQDVRSQFYEYMDGQSCERIYNYIKEKL